LKEIEFAQLSQEQKSTFYWSKSNWNWK